MFRWFGNFIAATPWLWVLLWGGVFLGVHFAAPAWDEHISESELTHLPEDIATRRANRLFDKAFPGSRTESNVVIVVERTDRRLQEEDYVYVATTVVPRLKEIAASRGGVLHPSLLDTLRELLKLKEDFSNLAEMATDLEMQIELPQESAPPVPENGAVQNGAVQNGAVREVPLESEGGSPSEATDDRTDRPSNAESATASQDDGERIAEQAKYKTPAVGSESSDSPTRKSKEKEPGIVAITAPHNSLAGPLLISEDEHAMVVLIDLDTEFLTTQNEPLLEEIEQAVESFRESTAIPDGLKFYVTGSAMLGRDVVRAVTRSTDAVQKWTIWLVLGLLLATFRAPLAAIVPLATMFLAVSVSLDVIAMLAAGGRLAIFDGLEIYTTVLVYGAGVDYSMFLISRMGEEKGEGMGMKKAVAIAVTKVGLAIVISAATEIFGIGMLTFADFGKFWQAGYAIPIGLAITLLASLTLTPSLMRICGQWAFWPLKFNRLPEKADTDPNTQDRVDSEHEPDADEPDPDEPEDDSWTYRLWHRIGLFVQLRPLLVWSVTVALLAPLCIVAIYQRNNLSYDIVSGLPADIPSLEGTEKLEQYFSNGITGPIEVLLHTNAVDFRSDEGVEILTEVVQGMRERADELGLADVRGMSLPTGFSPRAIKLLKQLKGSVPEEWRRMMARLDQHWSEDETDPAPSERLLDLYYSFASDYFVSQAEGYTGHVTRLTLVLDDNPFARRSITRVDDLYDAVEAEIPAALENETEVLMLGPTASLFDVRRTAEADRKQMQILVTAAVFIILVVLLRKVLVPLYLVISVVFTYLVTMGITFLVFQWWVGSDFAGLEWTVPILLFTLLMAVGADYNVLLVERFDEEKEEHGANEAVVRSVAATGGLITAAGVVMAGTFLALNLGGEMASMHQLGFALACGVLVDTFIVRPILVPSFLLIVEASKSRKWKAMVSKRHSVSPSAASQDAPS